MSKRNTSSSQQGIRRLVTLVLEVGLLAVLALIVFSNWKAIRRTVGQADDKGPAERRAIAEPSGDKAAELEAAQKLTSFKDKTAMANTW